jgi:hypothetical protein
VAGALLAVAATPVAALAQQQLQPVRVSPSEALVRAEALHARGTHEGESLDRLKKASKLHQQSAELRQADDPRRAECLRESALLRYYAGDRRGAAPIMVRAAESAVERGDVVLAAQSFSDAAIMAHETKQPARAWELGVRADVLTSSPLLTEAQRLALRERIVRLDRESRVVMAAGRSVTAAGEHR